MNRPVRFERAGALRFFAIAPPQNVINAPMRLTGCALGFFRAAPQID